MSKTITALKLTRTSEVRNTTLVLFGNPKDPEVAKRINKSYITGQKVEVKPRPDYDTGIGMCGNHLCHCKTVCSKEYELSLVGETLMGKSF